MFIGHVTGYLGSDAKKTQKGYSFNVSTKYKPRTWKRYGRTRR